MRIINSKEVKISKQARIMISNLKDFDVEEFKDWYCDEKLIIGDTHVTEYLIRIKGDANDDKD